MESLSVTASAVISFVERLENDSSKFYEGLAERFVENKETFRTFAKVCRKNKTLVIRTYQETISDALETGFSFEGVNLKDYAVERSLAGDVSYSDALRVAIELEKETCRFYLDVAERAQILLATIPKAFNSAAERRRKLRLELQSLLDEAMASS